MEGPLCLGLKALLGLLASVLPIDQRARLAPRGSAALGSPHPTAPCSGRVCWDCPWCPCFQPECHVHRPQVPEIVSVLRSKLQETPEEHVLRAAQHSVCLLAAQHCEAVVSSLLGSPLPFDRYWVPASLRDGWGFLLPRPPAHLPLGNVPVTAPLQAPGLCGCPGCALPGSAIYSLPRACPLQGPAIVCEQTPGAWPSI